MSALYSAELLRLTLGLAALPRLAAADGSATLRSRSCGSVVTADVQLSDSECVSAIGFDVRACVVGQATATLLGPSILGRNGLRVASLRAALLAYLDGETEELPTFLADLMPLRNYPARREAALLPFDAVLAAVDAALSRSRNAATSARSISVETNA